jgi:hypothetical protein
LEGGVELEGGVGFEAGVRAAIGSDSAAATAVVVLAVCSGGGCRVPGLDFVAGFVVSRPGSGSFGGFFGSVFGRAGGIGPAGGVLESVTDAPQSGHCSAAVPRRGGRIST